MLEDQRFDRKIFLPQTAKLAHAGSSPRGDHGILLGDPTHQPKAALLFPRWHPEKMGTSASRNMKLVASRLDGKSSSNLLIKIHPSPRSWDGHQQTAGVPKKSKLFLQSAQASEAASQGEFYEAIFVVQKLLVTDPIDTEFIVYTPWNWHKFWKIVVGRPLHFLGCFFVTL